MSPVSAQQLRRVLDIDETGQTRAIHLLVEGIPLPKGSPSIMFNKATRRRFVREKPETVAWQQQIRHEAATMRAESADLPTTHPVSLTLVFTLPRRKSAPKRIARRRQLAAVRPDLDKLCRAVMDALEGEIYVDDGRVTDLVSRKRVAFAADKPGVFIIAQIED